MAEVEKKNLPGSSKIPKPKSKKVPADLGGRCIVLGLSNREWNIKKKKKKRTFNEKGEDLSSKIPKPKSKKVSADLGGRCIVLGLSNREWNIKKKKKKKRTLNEKWEDSSVKKKKKSLNEKGEDSSVKKKKKSLNEKGEEGSDDLPQDVSDDLPEDVEEGSDDLPQDVSDDLPEDVKEGSDDLPQDVKEGSDDLPEDVMEGAVMNHGDKPQRSVRTIKLNRKYLPEDVMEGAVMNHGDKPRRSVRTIKPNPKYLQENEQLSKYGDTKTARTIMLVELKKLIEANPLFRDKLAFPTLKSSRLRTLINQRENEQLSKYGDTKIARTIMLVELKKLIKANPLFRDKLAFPTLKSSRLRTLINQRENEQLSKYGDTKIARTIMLVELKKLIKANPLFRDKLAFPTLKSSRLRTLINQRLEKESGFYFNMKFFEEKVLAGEWDEVEKYLAGFTKVDDNRYSMKIFFEIRKQKYLEALDR